MLIEIEQFSENFLMSTLFDLNDIVAKDINQ